MRVNIAQELSDESGQAMVEYGVLVALISIAAMAFLPGLGDIVGQAFQSARDAIDAVV
jgi:Flp pilus assembly pilin Flp